MKVRKVADYSYLKLQIRNFDKYEPDRFFNNLFAVQHFVDAQAPELLHFVDAQAPGQGLQHFVDAQAPGQGLQHFVDAQTPGGGLQHFVEAQAPGRGLQHFVKFKFKFKFNAQAPGLHSHSFSCFSHALFLVLEFKSAFLYHFFLHYSVQSFIFC